MSETINFEDNIILVPIKDIKYRPRFRTDHGDIPALASLIEEVGLLQPIGLTEDYHLVFGYRRIQAFKLLGLDKIPTRILPIKDDKIVLAEMYENTGKPWTFSERMDILKYIERTALVTRLGRKRVLN